MEEPSDASASAGEKDAAAGQLRNRTGCVAAAAAEPGCEADYAASVDLADEPASVDALSEPATSSAGAVEPASEPCFSAAEPVGDAAVKPSDDSCSAAVRPAGERYPVSGPEAERILVAEEQQSEGGLKCSEQRTTQLEGS